MSFCFSLNISTVFKMSMKIAFRWTSLVLVIAKFDMSYSTCSSYSFHVKNGVKGRALDTRIFMTSNIHEFPNECFNKCTENCRCLSFNVCGKQCQLNTDKNDMKSVNLKVKKGCSYYNLQGSQVRYYQLYKCK